MHAAGRLGGLSSALALSRRQHAWTPACAGVTGDLAGRPGGLGSAFALSRRSHASTRRALG